MNPDNAYMGEFLRTYKAPLVSINATLNYLLTKPARILPFAEITMEVMFPDVSFYQGDIDYEIMGSKTEAIILRAGQNKWIDTKFERNYAESKRKGLLIGVYWFYDGRASPGEQAQLLLSVLEGKEVPLGVYVDWEHNYGGAHEGLRNVVAMMEVIEKAGYRVGLYTGYFFFRANSNPITNASQYNYLTSKALWEAWYTNDSIEVRIPAPWSYMTFWQFGTPSFSWGQETIEIDMNFYNGTKLEFENIYGSPSEPTEPGEPMADYFELRPSVAGEYRSVRAQTTYPHPPHIVGVKIGQINPNNLGKAITTSFYRYAEDIVVSGDVMAKAGDIWWKVYEANGESISGWVAEIHLGRRYLTLTLIPENPTPTPTHPTLNIVISDDEGNYPTLNIEWKPK